MSIESNVIASWTSVFIENAIMKKKNSSLLSLAVVGLDDDAYLRVEYTQYSLSDSILTYRCQIQIQWRHSWETNSFRISFKKVLLACIANWTDVLVQNVYIFNPSRKCYIYNIPYFIQKDLHCMIFQTVILPTWLTMHMCHLPTLQRWVPFSKNLLLQLT